MAGRTELITLGGKERRLLYTISNTRLATAALQRFLPDGAAKLTYADAAMLVLRGDLDAVLLFLQAGFQHSDQHLELREVEKWVDKEVREGRKIADIGRPILEALKASNLIDIVYEPSKPEGDHPERPTVADGSSG